MVFGGRISVKYALKRADVARLDTLRVPRLQDIPFCDFHNIWAVWNKAKKTPGG